MQSKEDESLQDPMSVDVNSAMLVNVNNTMQIDVSNTMSVDIHNICNQEKDNKLESNVESKKVLEEHLCAI